MGPRRLLLYVPILIAVVLGVLPAAYLIFGAFWSSDPGYKGHLTLQNLQTVFSDPSLGGILANTLTFAAGASALAVLLATTLSILIQRTDAPFKRLTSYSLLLVLGLPWFVEDMGWNFLLQPRTGLYNVALSWLSSFFHPGLSLLGGTFVNVNTLGGMALVMGLGLTPLAYLVISPTFGSISPKVGEITR